MADRSAGWAAALHRPNVRRVVIGAAILGALLGVETFVLHVLTDPLADVRAYYDAGARLNAGQPLYAQPATTNEASFYRYPPLLAILFRPMALLPFPVAAVIWEVALVALFALTIWRLGTNERTWIVLAMLALPTVWSLVIGQAQVAVTLLTVIGSPWTIALATNLKLFPALIALWWIGRRDVRSLAVFAAWVVALAAVQLVLEPRGSLDFPGSLTFAQVGDVTNQSLYAISPWLWAVAVVIGGLVTLRLAPTRYGWAAAVAFSVLATPRLLVYQLSTLVAGLGGPDRSSSGPRGT